MPRLQSRCCVLVLLCGRSHTKLSFFLPPSNNYSEPCLFPSAPKQSSLFPEQHLVSISSRAVRIGCIVPFGIVQEAIDGKCVTPLIMQWLACKY